MSTAQAAALFKDVRQYPRLYRLPSFKEVTAGEASSILLPKGLTYHAIQLLFAIAGTAATKAQIVAQVEWVRLTIDGDLKVNLTGAEVAYLQDLYTTHNSAQAIQEGILTLWLSRPWEWEVGSVDGPAYGLADVDSAELEIVLAAGATIDSCNGRALVTKGMNLGRHICIRRTADNQASAGIKELSDFVKRPDIQLYAAHIADSNYITNVKITADDVVEFDGAPAFMKAAYRARGLSPASGWWSHLFNWRGRPSDGLPMIMQDLRVELTTGTALGNFVLLREQIEG